jgi:hypothetical protein
VFSPYARAAVDQFSPKRQTLTQRVLDNWRARQANKGK